MEQLEETAAHLAGSLTPFYSTQSLRLYDIGALFSFLCLLHPGNVPKDTQMCAFPVSQALLNSIKVTIKINPFRLE